MKTKAPVKKKNGRRLPQNIGMARAKFSSQPVCLHRLSASEFSCGIDEHRAFLIEESWMREKGEADDTRNSR